MLAENHPVWRIAKLALLLGFLAFLLYMNASSFDKTELSTILWWVLGALGLETAAAKLLPHK